MKPVAYMTTDKRMLIFSDVENDDGMIPLYDGRDIDKIIEAIKKCFPHAMAKEGEVTQRYMELMELINK